MEIKNKICRECGTSFKPYLTTQKCCSSKCNFEHEKKRKEHKESQKIEAQGQNKKQLFNTAKIVVNAYVRAEAVKNGITKCFCCDKPLGKDFQAGHGFTGGANSNTIFDLDNIRPQRFDCNNADAGNRTEFLRRLEIELGEDRFNVLRENAHKEKRYSIDELLRIIAHYRKQTKILQQKN